MDDQDYAVLVLLVAALCLVIGMGVGCAAGRRDVQTQAIQAGAAYWYADPTNGMTTIKWRVELEKKTP